MEEFLVPNTEYRVKFLVPSTQYPVKAWQIDLIGRLDDDGGVEMVRLAFVFVLTLALPLIAEEKTGVSWAKIGAFCGQMTSEEPEIFPIGAAELKLYRATAKHLPCCVSAKALGDVRVDASGNFDLRDVAPGRYWLVARWKKKEVPIAFWYEGKLQLACGAQYKNVIKMKPSTGTAEISITTTEDSLANATSH